MVFGASRDYGISGLIFHAQSRSSPSNSNNHHLMIKSMIILSDTRVLVILIVSVYHYTLRTRPTHCILLMRTKMCWRERKKKGMKIAKCHERIYIHTIPYRVPHSFLTYFTRSSVTWNGTEPSYPDKWYRGEQVSSHLTTGDRFSFSAIAQSFASTEPEIYICNVRRYWVPSHFC